MKESEFETYCLEHAGEPLTAEAEAHLKKNPDLQRRVDQLIAVRKLVSLKRYEQAGPGCAERCQRNVAARIKEHESRGWLVRLTEWMSWREQPAMSLACAAAVLLCVAGVGVLLRGGETADVSLASSEPDPAPAIVMEPVVVEQPVAVAESAPEPTEVETQVADGDLPQFDKPLIVLRVDTNHQPTQRMSFGPGTSVPVSFDY